MNEGIIIFRANQHFFTHLLLHLALIADWGQKKEGSLTTIISRTRRVALFFAFLAQHLYERILASGVAKCNFFQHWTWLLKNNLFFSFPPFFLELFFPRGGKSSSFQNCASLLLPTSFLLSLWKWHWRKKRIALFWRPKMTREWSVTNEKYGREMGIRAFCT